MDPHFVLLVIVIAAALIFDFINGFHDTANAIATVVGTGTLPLRSAILIAAGLNFIGALTGTAVASTIGKDLITPDAVTQGVVLAALIGAIFWNLFTWYFGIPSSSSHALVGGLVGAGVARAGTGAVQAVGVEKVVNSLILSPIIGMFFGFAMMVIICWTMRRTRPSVATRRFRRLQLLSAGVMAFAHGNNDAQKTMGIVTMSLVAYGAIPMTGAKLPVPHWVMWACAIAMGLGTAAGGKRIIKTMGAKIVQLRPAQGFAAETSAALTILSASHFGLPVSTTHVISAAIMGVGATTRVSAVKWGITIRILWAWVLTIPLSSAVAFATYWIGSRLFG